MIRVKKEADNRILKQLDCKRVAPLNSVRQSEGKVKRNPLQVLRAIAKQTNNENQRFGRTISKIFKKSTGNGSIV